MSGATVALGPWGSQSGGGGGQNMLGMMGDIMKLRQTGAEWDARQRFGEIMSGSGGDLDGALKAAQSDPRVAAFAPQLMNELRQQQLLGYQVEGQSQSIAKSAREGLLNVLQVSGNDPTKLLGALQGQFGSYDARTQKLTKEYGDTIYKTLTDGLPSDNPAAAQAEYARRKALLMVSSKLLPDVGTAAGAGGFGVSSVHDVQGMPTGVTLDPFTHQLQIGGAPGQAAPGIGAGGGLPLPVPATGGAAPAPATAPTPAPEELGVDGKPLYDPATSYKVPYTFGTGGTGAPILAGPMVDEAKALAEKHGKEDLQSYQAAQQTRSSLVQMDAAYDNLIKDGGFLQPGTLARARAQMAGAANTVSQLFGNEPYFDPSKVASAEQFNKETERMALQVTRQFLGGQKEAAQTINRVASSVPSIENSYLGGKLIIAGIRASNQRLMDERTFQNGWLADPKHGGNLLGAAEAFNARAPAESYANKELDSFGLLPNGKFKDPAAVMQMRNRGLMTDKQIETVLADQFGIRRAAPAP